MALRRRACVFRAFAVRRRALFGALLAFISLSVLSPPSARSGESQPIDSSRIVSIGGAVTETIYALGLEGRIVGVDTTSLFPPEALKRAPNVGYMRALSAEGILSLKPSWVIAIDGSGPPAALKLVADAGVPLTMVHDEPSPDGVAAKIETIGKLLGAEEKPSRSPMTRALALRWLSICVRRRRSLRACFSSCLCRTVGQWSGVAGQQPTRLSASPAAPTRRTQSTVTSR